MRVVQVVFLSFFLFCAFNAQAANAIPIDFSKSYDGISSFDTLNDTGLWLAEIFEEDDRSEESLIDILACCTSVEWDNKQKFKFNLFDIHLVVKFEVSDIHSRGPPIQISFS